MDTVESVLAHYGIKGMRWGVRRTRAQLDADSADATNKKALQTVVKKNRGSTDPLSNQELQALVTRLNLEQQYSNLTTKQVAERKTRQGQVFVSNMVRNVAQQQIQTTANKMLSYQIEQALIKKGALPAPKK